MKGGEEGQTALAKNQRQTKAKHMDVEEECCDLTAAQVTGGRGQEVRWEGGQEPDHADPVEQNKAETLFCQ